MASAVSRPSVAASIVPGARVQRVRGNAARARAATPAARGGAGREDAGAWAVFSRETRAGALGSEFRRRQREGEVAPERRLFLAQCHPTIARARQARRTRADPRHTYTTPSQPRRCTRGAGRPARRAVRAAGGTRGAAQRTARGPHAGPTHSPGTPLVRPAGVPSRRRQASAQPRARGAAATAAADQRQPVPGLCILGGPSHPSSPTRRPRAAHPAWRTPSGRRARCSTRARR
jgi:hypothetical protein